MDLTKYNSMVKQNENIASILIGEKLDNMAIHPFQRLISLKYFLLEGNEKEKYFLKNPSERMAKQNLYETDTLLFFSHLWVLGIYEILRALDQKVRKNQSILNQIQNTALKNSKNLFERIRIPMAKFESPKRFVNDSGISYPVMNPSFGIGWAISHEDIIPLENLTRGLDNFIETLNSN